uniref:Uncharacterized protein n=1 Tax=Anguilla anguilla TaxID=7936 RepID=A0A0E9R640_ANGAN
MEINNTSNITSQKHTHHDRHYTVFQKEHVHKCFNKLKNAKRNLP